MKPPLRTAQTPLSSQLPGLRFPRIPFIPWLKKSLLCSVHYLAVKSIRNPQSEILNSKWFILHASDFIPHPSLDGHLSVTHGNLRKPTVTHGHQTRFCMPPSVPWWLSFQISNLKFEIAPSCPLPSDLWPSPGHFPVTHGNLRKVTVTYGHQKRFCMPPSVPWWLSFQISNLKFEIAPSCPLLSDLWLSPGHLAVTHGNLRKVTVTYGHQKSFRTCSAVNKMSSSFLLCCAFQISNLKFEIPRWPTARCGKLLKVIILTRPPAFGPIRTNSDPLKVKMNPPPDLQPATVAIKAPPLRIGLPDLKFYLSRDARLHSIAPNCTGF